MQGPTANRFAHVIVGEVRVLCCPLGFTLLSVGASPAFALAGGAWAYLFSLSGPCSRGCRAAWADVPSGGVRVSPVYLRSGRCWCCRVRVGNARSPVWGWCGFRACRRWGVGDDGIPRDCTRCGCSCGVSLYSSARCCSLGLRVCLSVRAWLCEWRVVVCACCAICFWWGVLLRASRCARLAVCLSAVSCSVACCWFVAVCFVCRLLCGVRFVSAPAPTVTWFMQVCAGVHLTATVVVVYRLPCNGRFWQFAARFCVPGCSR